MMIRVKQGDALLFGVIGLWAEQEISFPEL